MNLVWRIPVLVITLCLLLTTAGHPQFLPECYHTRAEVDSFVRWLDNNDTLNIVRVDSIGHSRGQMLNVQYPIWAVKISDNADVFENEPTVLIIAHIHAEEVIGLELTLEYMRRLKAQFFQYRDLINTTQLYFIPTMNPDGLEVISRGLDNTWRKNGYIPPQLMGRDCQVIPGVGEDSCGVDLNRNFDINWIYGDTLWYRTAVEPFDYFRGPAPFSEPEAQAVRDFALQIKPTVSIVYHSSRQGGVAEMTIVAWKWGYDPGPYKFPPDCTAIGQINSRYASLLPKTGGGGTYQPNIGNTHNGCLQDWFYWRLGCIQVLTELGPPRDIQPPCASLEHLINDLDMPSLDWLCKRPMNLERQGPTPLAIYTRDAQTGGPISAEWRILNTWSPLLAPWYTNAEFGRATFLPPPGPITIIARKQGYIPDTASLQLNPNSFPQQITLDLQPLPWHNVSFVLRRPDGQAIPGRIYLDGEYPEWVTVPAGGVTRSLPTGQYFPMCVADAAGYLALWRHFWLDDNLTFEVTLPFSQEILFEDFESGLSNWSTGGAGNGWRLFADTTSANFGQSLYTNPTTGDRWPIVYPNHADTWIRTNTPLSLSGNAAYLEFFRRGRLDVPGDSILVEVSPDGNDWQQAAGFCDMELPWTRSFVNLTSWTPGNLYLRFRMKSDSALGELGILIDNLRVFSGTDLSAQAAAAAVVYSDRITGAYPNPFNPATTITYEVSGPGTISLTIFNTLGEEIRRFETESAAAGIRQMVWDGLTSAGINASSGLYFVQLRGASGISTHKLLLLR